ncbi:MAG: hypothetical protein WCQ45_02915 [bacterium]
MSNAFQPARAARDPDVTNRQGSSDGGRVLASLHGERIVYAGFSPAEVDAFERCPTRVLENLSKAEGVPLGKKVM